MKDFCLFFLISFHTYFPSFSTLTQNSTKREGEKYQFTIVKIYSLCCDTFFVYYFKYNLNLNSQNKIINSLIRNSKQFKLYKYFHELLKKMIKEKKTKWP